MAMTHPKPDFDSAIIAWKKALGDPNVETGAQLARYHQNMSALDRVIPAVLHPSSTEEVSQLVEIANRFHTPVYPISTGRNWGLGSRLPVQDDTAVVDLGRMNRIHEINVEHHYAVIEPGVTQRQLYEYLRDHDFPLLLNVTGSGADTSLIGNSLERGIGYFSSRTEGLSGLEVVLGNGQVIQTGFGHYATSRLTHHYRHGIGPSLDGLFFQSNFGIVTRAGFDLIPNLDEQVSVVVKIADEKQFVPLVDALVDLRRRGIMRTVWHVGNRCRSEISLGPMIYDELLRRGTSDRAEAKLEAMRILEKEGFGEWNAVGGVFGTPGALKEACREINNRLRGIAKVMFLTDRKIEWADRILKGLSFLKVAQRKRLMLEAMSPLYGMSKGIPSDGPVKSVLWPVGEETAGEVNDPAAHYSGMMYILPFFPLSGRCAQDVVSMAQTAFTRHHFQMAITINFVDAKAAEAVISLPFDKRDEQQVAAAHQCINELTDEYVSAGFLPYRVGVQNMRSVVNPDDPFWQTVRDLKKVLDPNQIIAPGRYNLI